MNIIDKKYEGLYIIMQLTFAKDGTYGHHRLSDGDIISITPKIVKKVYCVDQSEFNLMMIDIINLNSRENKEDNDVWLMHYFIKDSEYSLLIMIYSMLLKMVLSIIELCRNCLCLNSIIQ